MTHSPWPKESERGPSSAASALRSLATDGRGRSNTARLRDVFAEVQAALEAGVRRRTILETLNAEGFKLSLKGFESALYRIRKQNREFAAYPQKSPAAEALTSLPHPVGESDRQVARSTPGLANNAVREALTNQQSREEKFSRYSNSKTLSTRLGQKKE